MQAFFSHRLGVIQRQLERKVNTLNFSYGYRHSTTTGGMQGEVLTFVLQSHKGEGSPEESIKEVYLHPCSSNIHATSI